MALTWNTATLLPIPGEEAIKLNYFDSGSPPTATHGTTAYTTVIAVHGLAANGGAWKYAAPLFAKSHRFLAYNRRGYEGSSDHYNGSVKDAVGRYMMDLVGLMRYAVEELGVPAKDANGNGGIILLGWSQGTATPITLLSLLASPVNPPFPLPAELDLKPYLSILSTHLRHIILFDPAGESVGLPYENEEAVRHPTMASIKAFEGWIFATVPEERRSRLDESVDDKNALQDFEVWTAERMDKKECARVAETGLKHVPKNIGVGLLHCTGTIDWVVKASAWIVPRLGDQQNTIAREIPGGHHYFQITDPEIFVPAVESMITELNQRVEV